MLRHALNAMARGSIGPALILVAGAGLFVAAGRLPVVPVPGQLDHPPDVIGDPDGIAVHQKIVAAVAEDEKGGLVFIEPLGKPDQAVFAQLPGHSSIDHQVLD